MMTHYNAEEYAKAVQEYEQKRKHLYLFPHDGLSPFSYIKSFDLNLKWLIISILAFIAGCALMSAMLLIVKIPFMTSFIGWAIFFIVLGIIYLIYGYFLHINYIKETGETIYAAPGIPKSIGE